MGTKLLLQIIKTSINQFSQVPKKCAHLDPNLLYILILGTYSKFARENNFPAPVFAFRSPARALAAVLPHQDHVHSTTDESFCFHTKKSMKCVVNWIPMRIRVRLTNTQPHLNVELGVSQTNADSQWNEVFNTFHHFLLGTK